MKKLVGAFAGVALALVLLSPPAEARCWGYGWHCTHYRHHYWHSSYRWHPYRYSSWYYPRYYYPYHAHYAYRIF